MSSASTGIICSVRSVCALHTTHCRPNVTFRIGLSGNNLWKQSKQILLVIRSDLSVRDRGANRTAPRRPAVGRGRRDVPDPRTAASIPCGAHHLLAVAQLGGPPDRAAIVDPRGDLQRVHRERPNPTAPTAGRGASTPTPPRSRLSRQATACRYAGSAATPAHRYTGCRAPRPSHEPAVFDSAPGRTALGSDPSVPWPDSRLLTWGIPHAAKTLVIHTTGRRNALRCPLPGLLGRPPTLQMSCVPFLSEPRRQVRRGVATGEVTPPRPLGRRLRPVCACG